MSISLFVFLCIASTTIVADEIDPVFESGYRMGYFMAVTAANIDKKICGNVHSVTLDYAIKNFINEHGKKAVLKYDEVLDLLSKSYPCAEHANAR